MTFGKSCDSYCQMHQQAHENKRKHQHPVQQIQQIQERRVPVGVEPFMTPDSDGLDQQRRRMECGTLVLEPQENMARHEENRVLQVQRDK